VMPSNPCNSRITHARDAMDEPYDVHAPARTPAGSRFPAAGSLPAPRFRRASVRPLRYHPQPWFGGGWGPVALAVFKTVVPSQGGG